MNEYHKFIQDTYNWARYMGICRTKSEFAKIVGVCPSTISASSQERYSGKNTAKKIKAWLKQYESDNNAAILGEPIEHDVPFDWSVFRAETSARVLAGFAMNARYIGVMSPEPMVRHAIEVADELIKLLKNHE